MRLIATYAGPRVYAKVYRDIDWNEYRVKFYREGGLIYLHEADYHTSDKQEALDAADAWTTKETA